MDFRNRRSGCRRGMDQAMLREFVADVAGRDDCASGLDGAGWCERIPTLARPGLRGSLHREGDVGEYPMTRMMKPWVTQARAGSAGAAGAPDPVRTKRTAMAAQTRRAPARRMTLAGLPPSQLA